jgi:hypothetical protein
MDDNKGLYSKYLVFKNDGNIRKTALDGCFVLRPEHDTAAYDALWTYAEAIGLDNRVLADDLRKWLYEIADKTRAKAMMEQANDFDRGLEPHELLKREPHDLVKHILQLEGELQRLERSTSGDVLGKNLRSPKHGENPQDALNRG